MFLGQIKIGRFLSFSHVEVNLWNLHSAIWADWPISLGQGRAGPIL